MITVPMKVSVSEASVPVSAEATQVPVSCHVGADYHLRLDEYAGPFEITPNSETQVLATEETRVRSNIIINPIPNNYGLITWNGSYLTVS